MRYFLGKFGKEENELKLSEINKSFVVFEMDEDDDVLHAVYSNTDVKVGEKWKHSRFDKATVEHMAYSNRKRNKRNPSDIPGQQKLEVMD